MHVTGFAPRGRNMCYIQRENLNAHAVIYARKDPTRDEFYIELVRTVCACVRARNIKTRVTTMRRGSRVSKIMQGRTDARHGINSNGSLLSSSAFSLQERGTLGAPEGGSGKSPRDNEKKEITATRVSLSQPPPPLSPCDIMRVQASNAPYIFIFAENARMSRNHPSFTSTRGLRKLCYAFVLAIWI